MKPYMALMVAMACSSAMAGDISAVEWKAAQIKTLNGTANLASQTQSILARTLPNADLVPSTVGEARFADLDRDGGAELIATVDYSGRGFYNNIVTLQRDHGRYLVTEMHVNGPSITDLARHIVDADGDGRLEFVADRYIDQYEGAVQVPQETLVYRWDSKQFKENSEAYPGYYRAHVIPKLEAKLKTLAATPSTSARRPDDYEAFIIKTELRRAKQRVK